MEPSDCGLFLPNLANPIKNQPRILNFTCDMPNADGVGLNKSKKVKRECLTTNNAVKFLLEGQLKRKVCRYCLNVTSPLSELDQVLQVGGSGVLYKVTIRNMVASFYPYKVTDDPNFPNKICNKCLNQTIRSYLFTQQCERSERALRNCLEDMYNKFEKLDPLEPQKKRGRQKLIPNHNVLYAEHEKVIDYAEPLINIVNSGAELTEQVIDSKFECPKCWQILPNLESLLNHEKQHPKSMWYSCRHCGKSFTSRNHLKKHVRTTHEVAKPALPLPKTDFKCAECGVVSEKYNEHLQHIEKHKFQNVLERLIEKNMDELCAVCLDVNPKLVDLEEMVCLHGGFPEMMGERTLYSIIGSTVPDMNNLHNFPGKKICENCLNHAITSYVFIHQTLYVRDRFDTCLSLMLDSLNQLVKPEANVFIEISQNTIMPLVEPDFDENLLLEEHEIDESKLKIEVLEDEFRQDSDSESSASDMDSKDDLKQETVDFIEPNVLQNLARKAEKTYENRKLINGVSERKYNSYDDVCSEFLTFKKRKKPVRRHHRCKYTCPKCNKHFISEYFLKRHILKHVFRKVECTKCNLQFKSKFYLYEHTKMCHILNQYDFFSCSTCGRAFESSNNLDQHLKCHKAKECQLCGKEFLTQEYYDSHMQRHAGKLQVLPKSVQTCSFCEKECANDNGLSVHVNKIHLQIKPYSCDMCEKQFYTEFNLNCHKKVHNLLAKEKCIFCNKTLKCRRDLVVHIRKHIGVQPYTCPVCGQTFYSSNKVEKHMKTTHGGKFCCKLCKTIFPTKFSLKDHINRVHNMI
ncbi:zinc finger protein 814-like isoform X2 [Ostrinia furnacalis]|uniref:zinc finger protein 814-like isoform X2 n=1 Tax=Ostrinia furnacalis TaxID=93504 RepID=UPI00103DB057|nr:zinc finger protein 814-like isoform X2 [Ostrinia furnacalis]